MNSLPVIAREMLVSARRPGTYWQRPITAAAAIGVMAMILSIHGRFASVAALSLRLFVAVSILGFAYALLSGVFLTADCICTERREGTLPLLFLTKLNGFDVVLGKLCSTSLVSGYALLAILPVMGIPMISGGVTGGEFARVSLSIILALAYSLTTELLCSTLCRDTRGALGMAFSWILMLAGVLYVLLWILEELIGLRGALDWYSLSPLGAFLNGFDTFHRTVEGPGRYWTSICSGTALALAQFVAAALLVRQSPISNSTSVPVRPPIIRFPRTVGEKPLQWLLLRDRSSAPAIRLVSLILFLVWGVCLVASLMANRNLVPPLFITSMTAAFVMHVYVKGLVVAQASRRLAEDRQSGALELLLVSPVHPRELISAQRRAVWKRFRGLLSLLLMMNAALIVTVVLGRHQLQMSSGDQLVFESFFVGGMIMLLLDVPALVSIAMSEALRGKRHHRAILGSLLRGLAPSWLALFCFIFIGMGINVNPGIVMAFFWIWTIVSSVMVLTLGLWRAHELGTCFRQLAAEGRSRSTRPYERPAPNRPPLLVNAARG